MLLLHRLDDGDASQIICSMCVCHFYSLTIDVFHCWICRIRLRIQLNKALFFLLDLYLIRWYSISTYISDYLRKFLWTLESELETNKKNNTLKSMGYHFVWTWCVFFFAIHRPRLSSLSLICCSFLSSICPSSPTHIFWRVSVWQKVKRNILLSNFEIFIIIFHFRFHRDSAMIVVCFYFVGIGLSLVRFGLVLRNATSSIVYKQVYSFYGFDALNIWLSSGWQVQTHTHTVWLMAKWFIMTVWEMSEYY